MCMWVVYPCKTSLISVPSCVLAVLTSLHLCKWHHGAYYSTTFSIWVLSLGRQKCWLEKHLFLLRLWQLFWEGSSLPEMVLSILGVLLSGSKLWAWAMYSVLGMWGKQQCMQNFKAEGHSQCCLLWADTRALDCQQMQFQESVSVFERLVLWSIVSHHSQWSVAYQFVGGKCIVGEVLTKSPKMSTSPLCSDNVWGKCWLDLYSSWFPEWCRIFWNCAQFCFMLRAPMVM